MNDSFFFLDSNHDCQLIFEGFGLLEEVLNNTGAEESDNIFKDLIGVDGQVSRKT